MKTLRTIFAAGALAAAAGFANAQVFASDEAANPAYDFGWFTGVDGGTGFGPWFLTNVSENGDGFAGFFIAEEPNDGLSNIATGDPGQAFAIFANGGTGREAAVAYREIENPLDEAGEYFEIGLENGGIAGGGQVGFALRTGNASGSVDDFGAGARLQFYFEGGMGNYLVADGGGVLDTGAPFTFDGLRVRVTLTGPSTYDIEIFRYADEIGSGKLYEFTGRTLAGSGPIESVALFSIDGGGEDGNNDAYFNALEAGLEQDEDEGCTADLNGDDVVNVSDLLAYLGAYRTGC